MGDKRDEVSFVEAYCRLSRQQRRTVKKYYEYAGKREGHKLLMMALFLEEYYRDTPLSVRGYLLAAMEANNGVFPPKLKMPKARETSTAICWSKTIVRHSEGAVKVEVYLYPGPVQGGGGARNLYLADLQRRGGAAILKCLEGFQVRDTLPPPLPMGRSSKTTYNTAVLKRYPRALCRAIAEIAGEFANRVPYTYAQDDEVNHVAQFLRRIYTTRDDQMDDGNDFAGDRN